MMVGTATFRIVLSSTMMNNALDRITRAIHRFWSLAALAAGPGRLASMVAAMYVSSVCRQSERRPLTLVDPFPDALYLDLLASLFGVDARTRGAAPGEVA